MDILEIYYTLKRKLVLKLVKSYIKQLYLLFLKFTKRVNTVYLTI